MICSFRGRDGDESDEVMISKLLSFFFGRNSDVLEWMINPQVITR